MLAEEDSTGRVSGTTEPFGLALCMALTALAFLGFSLATRASSWFYGDDYLAFHLLAKESFADYLTTPVDVHFIPLHRLVVGLTQILFPFNFDVTLVLSGILHLACIWVLYRCLQLIEDSALSAPLACLLGTNFYAAACLPNWTAGIARFAYILLSTVAILQYLKFRGQGGLLRGLSVVACSIGAAAFFSKAFLIPGYLAALEIALLPGAPRRDFARKLVLVAGVTLAMAAYYWLGLSYGTGRLEAPPLDWNQQVRALEIVAAKFPQSILGVSPYDTFSIVNWLVVALWGTVMVVSSRKDPFSAIVWIVGLCVVFVNFAVIALSQRMQLGPNIVAQDRYYFENLFLVALFLMVVARRTGLSAWLAQSPRRRPLVGGVWVAVFLLAVGSQATYLRALEKPGYATYPVAREYGLNLAASLADVRQSQPGTLRFAQGKVPFQVLGYCSRQIGDYAQFLPIFDADVVVSTTGACRYVVRDDGSIQRPSQDCEHGSNASNTPN